VKNAFTLIELLIVIAIIALLSAILYPFIGQTPLIKSRDAKRLGDLDNLLTSINLYYHFNGNNSYPASLNDLVPTVIASVPIDPRDGKPGCNVSYGNPTADTTYKYNYYATSATGGACSAAGRDCANYVLQVCLEDANNPALANDCDSGGIPACAPDRVYDIHS